MGLFMKQRHLKFFRRKGRLNISRENHARAKYSVQPKNRRVTANHCRWRRISRERGRTPCEFSGAGERSRTHQRVKGSPDRDAANSWGRIDRPLPVARKRPKKDGETIGSERPDGRAFFPRTEWRSGPRHT